MKSILKGIGIAILAIFSLLTVLALWTYSTSTAYEKTAVPYIYEVLPELTQWDVDVWFKYMDESVVKSMDREQAEKVAVFLSKMGAFESMDPPKFNSVLSSAAIEDGTMRLVTYTFLGHFSNGNADIKIVLRDMDDEFSVYKFNLHSSVLIDP